MSLVWELAAGIFLGLVAFTVFIGVLGHFAEQRQIAAFNEQLRARQRPPASARAGEKLAADEECIAGTIVRRSTRNGVPAAEQVLENNRPVSCTGDRRR